MNWLFIGIGSLWWAVHYWPLACTLVFKLKYFHIPLRTPTLFLAPYICPRKSDNDTCALYEKQENHRFWKHIHFINKLKPFPQYNCWNLLPNFRSVGIDHKYAIFPFVKVYCHAIGHAMILVFCTSLDTHLSYITH